MKLIFSLLSFMLFSTGLMSQDLSIAVGGKNELILTANKCETLLKQQAAICQWKKKISPDFISTELNSCQKTKKGKFQISIYDCLPDLAKNYQQKKLVHDGPNCWGTAMSFNKLSITPRFMWPEEMQYWMESPLCRKLNPEESILPGDVINVYAPEKLSKDELNIEDAGTNFWKVLYPKRLTAPGNDNGSGYSGFHRLLHSVTYLSDQLAFGKDSPSHEDSFYFHSMEQVYGRPRSENKECQENQTLQPHLREYQKIPKQIRGSKCSYFSLAYRCENFADYFSQQNLTGENLEIWKNIQSLQGLQEKLFPLVTSSQKILDKCEITLILSLADLTIKKSADGFKGADKVRERLLVMQYFAAAGIRQTLEQAGLR